MKKIALIALFASALFGSCWDVVPEIIGAKLQSFLDGGKAYCEDNVLYVEFAYSDDEPKYTDEDKKFAFNYLKKLQCKGGDNVMTRKYLDAIHYTYKTESGTVLYETTIKNKECAEAKVAK